MLHRLHPRVAVLEGPESGPSSVKLKILIFPKEQYFYGRKHF